MDSFSDLCNPAKLYVILAAFSLIGMIIGKQYGPAAAKFIFAVIFTYFLNWICSNGYPGVSWFLVLIPFVIIGVAFAIVLFAVAKVGSEQESAQQNHPMQTGQQPMQTGQHPSQPQH